MSQEIVNFEKTINEEPGLNIAIKKRLLFTVFNLVNHLSSELEENAAAARGVEHYKVQLAEDDEEEAQFSPEKILEEINVLKKKSIKERENAAKVMERQGDEEMLVVVDEKEEELIDVVNNNNSPEGKKHNHNQQRADVFEPKRAVIVSPKQSSNTPQVIVKPRTSSTCSSMSAASSCPSPLSSVASSSPSSPASDSFKMDRLLSATCSKASEQVAAAAVGTGSTPSKTAPCVSSPN